MTDVEDEQRFDATVPFWRRYTDQSRAIDLLSAHNLAYRLASEQRFRPSRLVSGTPNKFLDGYLRQLKLAARQSEKPR